MINYIVNSTSCILKFDDDTKKINTIQSISPNIDWLWIADEDGFINADNTTEVKAGDLIISFYNVKDGREDRREVIVVTDNNIRDYYKRLKECRDKAMEELRSRRECEACEASNSISC